MRVKKSFLNATTNSLILVIRSVLMFAVRIVFVRTLGQTLLGVDSLFTNLLLVLSMADSGISTAINFSLYKPLSDKDYDKVSILMSFYKRVYRTLGLIVIGIGIAFIPCLSIIIKEPVENLYLLYLIYLATTAITYFISYKDALLNADQNYYKSSIIVGSTYSLMYIIRIIFLIVMPNFIIYALIQLIMMFIQRILINRYITKQYSHIKFNLKEKLPKKETKEIFNKIESMFINKLGGFLVNGTDNIIISATLKSGLGVVAVYTNFYSIVNTVDTIITRGLSGVTSSFGDLAVNESKKTQEDVFNNLNFISFVIYGLFFVGFYFLLNELIVIFFGNNFKLGLSIILLICLNFYITGILKPLDVVKEATGNFVHDKYVNLMQAGINIILSIILAKYLGLFGIVLATFLSYVLLPLWNRPYVTYKYTFNKNPFNYFKIHIKYALSLVLIIFLISLIIDKIVISSLILDFIVKSIIISILYLLLIILIYFKTPEYKFYYNLVKKVLKKTN